MRQGGFWLIEGQVAGPWASHCGASRHDYGITCYLSASRNPSTDRSRL